MVANKACACGAPVLAKGKCRRCYYVPYQARYRRKHREHLRELNREWQRRNPRASGEYSLKGLEFDALEIFCMALDCTPLELAQWLMSLRDPEREAQRLSGMTRSTWARLRGRPRGGSLATRG